MHLTTLEVINQTCYIPDIKVKIKICIKVFSKEYIYTPTTFYPLILVNGIQITLFIKASVIYFPRYFWVQFICSFPWPRQFFCSYTTIYVFFFKSQKISPILKINSLLWQKSCWNQFVKYLEFLVYFIPLHYIHNY